MLKRVVLFFLLIGLFGCSNRLTDSRIEVDNQKYDIMDYDVIKRSMGEEDSLVVGVLLPLTGKASSIGTGMQNAMFMALDDLQNDKLVLKFYDTKSSSSGASDAMSKALSEGVELILGPLMSEEVESIASKALSADVPVVSYTTSPQVLQKGIYSIGLLNGEQIDKAISYALSNNRTKLALLVPDNNSGLNILKSALMSSISHDVSLVKVGFYNPNTIDFTSIVQEMVAEVPVDFDAVLIADGGNRLKSMASMFAYNDVLYPDVLFLGTSAWDSTNLTKETMLYKGVYPMISKSYGGYFIDKYQDTFGEYPKPVYSFAYDSVLLASVLSTKTQDDIDALITGKNGFIGVNGYFKILPTGTSIHSLEMLEVTENGPKVVEKASKQLTDYTKNEIDVRYIPYESLPKIYGKNSTEVLGWLYNN